MSVTMSVEAEAAENVSGEDRVTVGADTHGDQLQALQKVATDDGQTTASGASPSPLLSKNQIKKLKKKERWLQIKAEKRQAEKEKKKKRFAEMKERGEDIGPSRKSLKKNRMVDSACRQRVVIDCSFDAYMTEKDTMFLVQQIQHSYAANRRADNPLQLYMCGIGGKAKQRLDNIGDYKGWDIHKEERDFTEVFPKEEIVYLSSESPNVLDTLDDSKVYIIGGLVDHNHHKGLCHRLAEERGLAHAQLPIGQFLQLKSRKVLTINHVFEILLRFTETQDWQTSLLTVLPQRKGVCLKASEEKAAKSEQSQDTQRHGAQINEETSVIDDSQEVSASVVNGSEELSISGNGPACDGSGIQVSVAEDTVNDASLVEEHESVRSTVNSRTDLNRGVMGNEDGTGRDPASVDDI